MTTTLKGADDFAFAVYHRPAVGARKGGDVLNFRFDV